MCLLCHYVYIDIYTHKNNRVKKGFKNIIFLYTCVYENYFVAKYALTRKVK